MIKNPIPGSEPLSYDEQQELQELVESMPSPGDPASFPAGEEPDYGRAFRLQGKRLAVLERQLHAARVRVDAQTPLLKWGLCTVGALALAALVAGLVR